MIKNHDRIPKFIEVSLKHGRNMPKLWGNIVGLILFEIPPNMTFWGGIFALRG